MAVVFWVHGGTREPHETIAPSYQAERDLTLTAGNSDLAPWVAHARFAPPGPGLVSLPTLHLVMPLFGAPGSYLAAPPELPDTALGEPAVLGHIADLVDATDSDPTAFEPEDAADQLNVADPAFVEDETTPSDGPPPPYWETTADPARNAELTDAHATPAEPDRQVETPAPSQPPEEESEVLSWLDRHLRTQPTPDQSAEPVYRPFLAPEEMSQEEDAPHERSVEPQPLPSPGPVAPSEPIESLSAVESQAEPPPVAPEPPPRGVVIDVPRSRRVEPRSAKRTPLPSLFTPSAKAPTIPAADEAPRSRRFGWRIRRRPAVPAIAGSVAAEATETLAFQPPVPVPLEPEPPLASPPLPSVVEDVRDEPQAPAVEAAPEPLSPPMPAELTLHDAPAAQDEPGRPTQPVAYWAEPTKSTPATPDQPENLAWTPQAVPAVPGTRRTTPAMEGLWETEPGGASDAGLEPASGTRRRIGRNAALVGGGVVVLVAASVAVIHFLPRAIVSNLVPAATFNAPMMVLRANGTGRVISIAVQNGQTVDPNTLLLTIRTEPQPDPAGSLLRMRLDAAQARMADLDQSLAQLTPATDAGRARLADLRRQRAAAVIDVAQLQDGVANIPAPKSSDLPVKAGVHGVIRSLEARSGTMTTTGVPLVRMLDCDHAFLTLPPDSKLRVGEAVQVRLPNLPPVAATVRQSAGIAEPPDSLVIATQPGAFIGQLSGSCPIGATATITPSMTGS